MTKDEQFDEIASRLIRYETGDFLLLSDISDEVMTLRDHFIGEEIALSVIEWMLKCIRDEMSKSGDKFIIPCLGERLDALRKLTKDMSKAERDELISRILTMKCKGKGLLRERRIPRPARQRGSFALPGGIFRSA